MNNKPVEAKSLTREVLTQLYTVERLSTVEIARRFSVSDETVRRRMQRNGIVRRTLSEIKSGSGNHMYKDGARVGEHEHGYQRKGWNPWNRGKTKETDPKEAAVAEKIRIAMQGHPTLRKPREEWTREDCILVTQSTAKALRVREAPLYAPHMDKLGEGWETEYFEDAFVFRRFDGLWRGFIVDIANPEIKVAIEVDGHYHSWDCQIVKDDEQDRHLRLLGWRILRVKSAEDIGDVLTLLK